MVEEQLYRKLLTLLPDLDEIEKLTLQRPKLRDFVVEVLERGPDIMRVMLAHYLKRPEGDMVADPRMSIEIDRIGKAARAMTLQMPGRDQHAQTHPDIQASLNQFLHQWLTDLIIQGFAAERAGRQRTR